MSGVDAVNIDSLDDTVELAKKLSLKTNAIIGVSGISDIVTDGKNTAVISGGHAMMKKITGSGCMLSSVIGAFAAANPNNLFMRYLLHSVYMQVVEKKHTKKI